jgi:phage terminase large subunit GpA-like protein
MGNLQSTSIRYQANDEIWDWDEGMFREADARLDAFRRVKMEKQVNVSQAGIEGSDWHRICFSPSTSFHEWQVPCIHCGVYQVLKMELPEKEGTRYLMQWDKDGSGIRYECPHCGKAMVDSASLKAHFNANGKYVDSVAPAERRTYRWNALAWSPWADLVREYREALEAKRQGVIAPLKSFILKKLAEFWREDESVPIVKPEFFDLDKAATPKDRVRFMTIDTQTDHFWACVREWEPDGSSRLLHWGRALSWSDLLEIQKRFEVQSGEWKALLAWTRSNKRGPRPQIVSRVLIDTGGDRTQDVYDACWNYGWVGLKGTDREDYIHRVSNAAGTKEFTRLVAQQSEILNYESRGAYLPLLLWATTGAKNILANLRDGKGRAWRVPGNIGDDYLKQINSEVKEASGANKWRWRKLGSRANHAWDCEAMQVLAASEAGIFKL